MQFQTQASHKMLNNCAKLLETHLDAELYNSQVKKKNWTSTRCL